MSGATVSELALFVLRLDPGELALGLIVLLSAAYGAARGLQLALVAGVLASPERGARLGRIEAVLSLLMPLALVRITLERAILALRRWVLRGPGKGKKDPKQDPAVSDGAAVADGAAAGDIADVDDGVDGADDDPPTSEEPPSEPPTPEEPPPPVRVATVGPSFFLAALLCGLLAGLGALVGPALGRALGLGAGVSAWQHLFLGRFRQAAWLLPLDDHPRVALVFGLAFWLVTWWTLGNLLRGLVLRSALSANHADVDTGDLPNVLPSWATAFGVVDLVRPRDAYRRWSSWVVTAASIPVGLGVLAVLGSPLAAPGQPGPKGGALAVGMVILLGWLLHLHLRGFERGPGESTAGESTAEESTDAEPESEGGDTSPVFDQPASAIPTLSPLLSDLAPDGGTAEDGLCLSTQQAEVLEAIARRGFVHLPPPPPSDELTLELDALRPTADVGASGSRVVLAPEGHGKTTLALLAAANQALVHARATLVVVRTEAAARALAERLQSWVEPSTVRWNLRCRRLGGHLTSELASDLARSIVPDIVVADLDSLVDILLATTELHEPFLRQVSLVIVDDVETFADGEATEIEARLAFRRLHLLFTRLAESAAPDVATAADPGALPALLALGTGTPPHDREWIEGLCSIETDPGPIPDEPLRHHLLAELTQHWVEVKDLAQTFGPAVVPLLRELDSRGWLVVEARPEPAAGLVGFEQRVWVRALSTALAEGAIP